MVVTKPIANSDYAASVNTQITTHTGNQSNPHVVSKTQVGLGNVDNTSDADKPISDATQTALGLKANAADVDDALALKADEIDLTTHTDNTENPHATTKTQVGLGAYPVDPAELPLADAVAEVTGTSMRTFEGGQWSRSGVDAAETGSEGALISSIKDGVKRYHGPVVAPSVNGTGAFEDTSRWTRCGKTRAMVGTDQRLLGPFVEESLGFSGRWSRCGYDTLEIGSNMRLLAEPEAQASEPDSYVAFSADDGTGELAVFSENVATGDRSRLSSVGSDATDPRPDGKGNVIWSAPANTKGALGNQYYAPETGGAEHAVRPIPQLACWGDSLTAQNWMAFLGASGLAVTAHNFGRSADTSLAIASRMGAIETLYNVDGGSIPASGAVSLTRAGDGDPLRRFGGIDTTIKGYFAGIWGTLTKSGGAVTFTRAAAGSAVSIQTAKFDWGYSGTGDTNPADDSALITNARDMVPVIFMGRNNFRELDTILAHFRAMVEHIATYTKRPILIPYLPGRSEIIGTSDYETRAFLLAQMQAEWPSQTLDLLPALLAAYDPGTPQDVTDVANGVPPSTLMTDNYHPNDAGKAIEAQTIADHITNRGLLL